MKAQAHYWHGEQPIQTWLARAIVALAGTGTILAGIALLFAPAWFFAHIGPYAPFNRHYEGDLGAFLLALGAGLFYAARAPWRHRALVAVAAAGNLLHAGNHIFDSLQQHATLAHWLADTAPLVAVALLLVWVAMARGAGEDEGEAARANTAERTSGAAPPTREM